MRFRSPAEKVSLIVSMYQQTRLSPQVLVGTMPNRDMLSKRHKLAFVRSVTLKPNVAYAMLRLAGVLPAQN